MQDANSERECRGLGQDAFIPAEMIRGLVGVRTDGPRVRSRGSTISMVEALSGAASAVALVLHSSR